MKYEIVGDTLPVVICHLNKGEKMISDSCARRKTRIACLLSLGGLFFIDLMSNYGKSRT